MGWDGMGWDGMGYGKLGWIGEGWGIMRLDVAGSGGTGTLSLDCICAHIKSIQRRSRKSTGFSLRRDQARSSEARLSMAVCGSVWECEAVYGSVWQ